MEIEQSTDISRAVAILASGRLVAFPTNTSYGLAADTQQGFALQRLRNLKNRPQEKTFTVFMKQALWKKFLRLQPEEEAFLASHTNRAITLLVEPAALLSHLAQDGRVGLRVIDHPLMQQLADAVDVPLTATSANKSEQQPCFSTDHIQEIFKNPIDDLFTYDLSLGFILDGGVLPKSEPSTIIKLENSQPVIIRAGKVNL